MKEKAAWVKQFQPNSNSDNFRLCMASTNTYTSPSPLTMNTFWRYLLDYENIGRMVRSMMGSGRKTVLVNIGKSDSSTGSGF